MTLYQRIQNPTLPVYVIAEMAWAHDGSLEKAKNIAKAASVAQADAINLHVTSVADYMIPTYGAGPGRVSNTEKEISSVYKYLENINLKFEEFKELAAYSHQLGLQVSVMCNDQASLEYTINNLQPDILMIHPSSVTDDNFVKAVASKMKPIVLYCGGLTLGEVESAILNCKSVNNHEIILQHGFQNYPTLIENNHIKYIKTLQDLFGLPVSFTDHTDADDPMALIVSLLAIPLGVRVLEKHITFNRAEKGEDFESALNPDEFVTFVKHVRQSQAALGSSYWQPLSTKQSEYRKVVFKRTVAARLIEKGEVLHEENITFMRSDVGLYPAESKNILGKVKAKETLEKGQPISWEEIL